MSDDKEGTFLLLRRGRRSKTYLLPMSPPQAHVTALPIRSALETVRCNQAGRRAVLILAHTALLTNYLSEAGFGSLNLRFVYRVKAELLAVLDRGKVTGDWTISKVLLEQITAVVDEHERQLREVRCMAVADATKRLERLIATDPQRLSLLHLES
ncbi:transcriptional regulator fis family protein [Caballeronia sp. LZ029]|uniref:transcriptional regulator fis family protein n=1 Tax=Caballeronia sp. LZ029 TaxID=3038564 RepID=UPI00285DE9AC|nr:transcriptional regulator fis family protein [Caballeronia sp. LZ029]MDR5748978.1 transcriptional regulator fis family protein [Caballeronia sp. LZ029]